MVHQIEEAMTSWCRPVTAQALAGHGTEALEEERELIWKATLAPGRCGVGREAHAVLSFQLGCPREGWRP